MFHQSILLLNFDKDIMFGDIFDTEEQVLTGVKEGQVQSSWDRLPRSCADQLKMPDIERKPGSPIGLKNIGQTCYLNSLLQILFHTPQLRKIILQLPLCVGSIQNKSDFFDLASKQKFMLGFQRLFSEMTMKDARSLTTEYLKDAFGWEGSEHVQQHDIQEAMKIIFDTFERALHGTEYEKNIKELFRGITSQYKSCKNCTITTEKLEDFYGLTVPVKNLNSLDESMLSFLTAQSMDGDNKIYCDTCQSKQDMWLGTRLKVLPEILVFTLRRFTFDYELMDRVKINDFFSFNLEYSLAHLLEEANGSQEYELYGVMVHRGSAHGGHYFCYIRDLMQQSDWKKSLNQAQQEQKKLEDWKQNQTELTEQQKKRRQQKQKEDKKYDLLKPENEKLLQNWFCLDDSRCQGIDAGQITTKFQGSESAYILFYRKKSLSLPTEIKVPEYFSTIIEEQNNVLRKEREIYEEKKKQIILNIDGKNQLISLETKVKDFMEIYCPMGSSLVNVAKHNDLPYYPQQINSLQDRQDDQLLSSLELIHQSLWKKYSLDDPQYQQIQPYINKDKMPFELNILYANKSTAIILYQDQILSELKYKITNKFDIAYEKQIIKLVTPYKEYFVTDDLKSDDVLLTKLGFVHGCQIILKKLHVEGEQAKEQKVEAVEEQGTMYCFVVERDDVHGIKRIYYDKKKTLKDLFDHIITAQAIPNDSKRRFRNLNGDRLFYEDQYSQTLEKLKFDEEIIKIRIQRGQIPVKGDICIKAIIQSIYRIQGTPINFEQIFDPNTSVADAKKALCQKCQLDPDQHKLYLTDWMGEPVRSINRQKLTLFETNFGREESICIRDIDSPIGSELLYFEVYQTLVGSPDDVSAKFPIKLEETKTLLDLKNMILESELCKDIPNLNAKKIRVRELKRDYMLGNILRNHKVELKSIGLNSNKIVVQILDFEQQLTDNQMVLLLKKRNVEKRIYEGHTQLVFEAGKQPSIQNLMKAVRQKLEVKQDEQIKIIKYIHYNFEWLEICEKSIDKFLKGKSNSQGKNKKKKGKKGEEAPQEKLQEKKEQKQQKNVEEEEKKEKGNKKKNKKGKNDNQPKDKEAARREECLNLRKAPFLLKDGDWIGYGFVEELKKDDLQTDQDLTLRHLRQNEKNFAKVYKKGEEKGFRVNLDF